MFSQKQRVPRDLIKKVISDGQKARSELFLINKLNNGLLYNRYAVIVSKKVTKLAVGRILIKRKVKGALKKYSSNSVNNGRKETKTETKKNDFVLIVFPNIKKAAHKKILTEIEKNRAFLC